uniref:TLC domain-containing protein n=1 Tax=Corethron hystrix TaxID=216773 RepID=A0A7S1FPP4_9STRA|mmetsp:Transcript_21295/g.48365  ORF Transcript_21295/g.48365 Transcript_21295/m.48365 type:complete len:258 (+) Transcript_21295:137-910(+)
MCPRSSLSPLRAESGSVLHSRKTARDKVSLRSNFSPAVAQHDLFNLVALAPLCILNYLNWDYNTLLKGDVKGSWTGEYCNVLFVYTVLYFIIDLVWVCNVKGCVKSPGTIIAHHNATLLYLLVPVLSPRQWWCMGACLSVEINTWFLIARRYFTKQGNLVWVLSLPPSFSIRIKIISIMFYITWIILRCILYPVLMYIFALDYLERWTEVGSPVNILVISVSFQFLFCLLNLKWTSDLLLSKIRAWKSGTVVSSKGL